MHEISLVAEVRTQLFQFVSAYLPFVSGYLWLCPFVSVVKVVDCSVQALLPQQLVETDLPRLSAVPPRGVCLPDFSCVKFTTKFSMPKLPVTFEVGSAAAPFPRVFLSVFSNEVIHFGAEASKANKKHLWLNVIKLTARAALW